MKLFFSRLFVSCLMLGGLVLAGCSSTPNPLDAPVKMDSKQNAKDPSSPIAESVIQPNAEIVNKPDSEVARFHVGETVSVMLSGTPDQIMPHEEQIKEDGTITLSLIGPIKAVGKTSGQLQAEIHDLYVPKYYVRLNVVVKAGDLIYYVRGEVKNPGRQLYVGETTVTKAITSAGDFTDYASHTVRLIRSKGEVIWVDVDKALKNPELDPRIYPGDQIDVRRSYL